MSAQTENAPHNIAAAAEYLLSTIPLGPIPLPRLAGAEVSILKEHRRHLEALNQSRLEHLQSLEAMMTSEHASSALREHYHDTSHSYSVTSRTIERLNCLVAPIRSLPVEIHLEILQYCTFSREVHPVSLLQVCRLWNRMFGEETSLWSRIHMHLLKPKSIAHAAHGMDRAGETCPLEVCLYGAPERPEDMDVDSDCYIPLTDVVLSGTMHRWSTLVFDGDAAQAYAFFELHQGAPDGLKELRIRLGGPTISQTVQIHLHLSRHARGISVSLSLFKNKIAFDPTLSLAVSHLEIVLGKVHDLEYLLELLRPYHRLTYLKLQTYERLVTNAFYLPPDSEFQSVELPSLTTLVIESLPDLSGLACMTLPALRSLDAAGFLWNTGTWNGLGSVLRSSRQLEAVVLKGKKDGKTREFFLPVSCMVLPRVTRLHVGGTDLLSKILLRMRIPLLEDVSLSNITAHAALHVLEHSPLLQKIELLNLHSPSSLSLRTPLQQAHLSELKFCSTAFAFLQILSCPLAQSLVLQPQEPHSPPPYLDRPSYLPATGFSSLRHLTLQGLNLKGRRFVPWLKTLSLLDSLRISECQLPDAALRQMSAHDILPNLRRLHILIRPTPPPLGGFTSEGLRQFLLSHPLITTHSVICPSSLQPDVASVLCREFESSGFVRMA